MLKYANLQGLKQPVLTLLNTVENICPIQSLLNRVEKNLTSRWIRHKLVHELTIDYIDNWFLIIGCCTSKSGIAPSQSGI